MKKLVLLLLLSLTACGRQDPAVMLKAYADSLAVCNGNGACIVALQAAVFTGQFSDNGNSPAGIIAAFAPWGQMGLELTRILIGQRGSMGQGFVLNKSNGNTFVLTRNQADRSSFIDAGFNMTSTPSSVKSYANMYNPVTNRDSNNGQ